MRINSHAHIFNLRCAMTEAALDMIRNRMIEDIKPEFAGRAVGDLMVDVIRGLEELNEETLLRELLAKISGDADFHDAVGNAMAHPDDLRSIFTGALEDLALPQLRRAVDYVVARTRRDRPDASKSDIHDVLETLRIAGKPDIAAVTDHLMRQLGPDDGVVALAMDVTVEGGADEDVYLEQLRKTSEAALAWPGRIFPFVGVNPRRGKRAVEIMKQALETQGFVGVKLYPATGFEVSDQRLKPVYEYCQEHKVPLLQHTSAGGFTENEAAKAFGDPAAWKPILADFPDVKICFAHFGGSSNLTKTQVPDASWTRTILDMMAAHPGVYSDVSFHESPMTGEEKRENYFKNLAKWLRDPKLRDKILFGTDFWFIRIRIAEANHWRFFEQGLSKDDFQRIAETNPSRFLGLPGHGQNDAMDAYVDLMADNTDKMKSPSTEWLLAAIAERRGAQARAAVEAATAHLRPAQSLVVPGFGDVLQKVADRTVGEGLRLPVEAGLDRVATSFSGSDVGVQANAKLSITTLGGASDTDEDGVVGQDAGSTDAFALKPQLLVDGQRAWVKYRAEGTLEVDAEAGGFTLDLAGGVTFADYRRHRPDERLRDVVPADLAGPRFALSRGSVLRLADGDALAFAARGSLAARVSVSWQDVLTSGLGRLSEALGSKETLMLEAGVAATVSARVEVEDDFRVVFSRQGEDFQVALCKLKTRGTTIAVELKGGVEWEDPDAFEDVLEQLLAQKIGEKMDAVANLLRRSEPTNQIEEALLARLEDKLGVQGIEAVRKAYEALEAKIEAAVTRIAEAKIEAGFNYEYSRTETNGVVLEARLKPRAMEPLHRQLVQGDTSGLLDRVQLGHADVELLQFLRQKEVVRRHAWGFTLGLAGLAAAGKNVVEKTFREQENVDGERKLSFAGLRSYSGEWGKTSWKWSADLKADMKAFKKTPAAGDFDFGLALLLEAERAKLGKTMLDEYLDTAVLWGVLDEGSLPAAQAEKLQALAGKSAEIRIQMVLDHDDLERVLPRLTLANTTGLADALAAAMIFRRDAKRPSGAGQRREIYSPLWKRLLEKSRQPGFELTLSDWALRAENHLRDEGVPQFQVENDSRDLWRNNPETFGGLLNQNRSVVTAADAFLEGCQLLQAAIGGTSSSGEQAPVEIFKAMKPFWSQSFYVRAVGAWLSAEARAAGAHVEPTFSITSGDTTITLGRT